MTLGNGQLNLLGYGGVIPGMLIILAVAGRQTKIGIAPVNPIPDWLWLNQNSALNALIQDAGDVDSA